MTVTTEALERAAFWDHAVCLDCGDEFEVEAPDTEFGQVGGPRDSRLAPCAECGSPWTFRASLVQGIIERVED